MTRRTRGVSRLAPALLAPALLLLSGCAPVGASTGDSSSPSGEIEMAVSELCTAGTDAQCVSVNGEDVELPATFVRAGVEAAAVGQGVGQNAIDVTLTAEGAALLHTLTEQAAGGTARLVLKVGDEVVAAAVVMEVLEGKQLQIALSPDDDAQKIVDLIQGA